MRYVMCGTLEDNLEVRYTKNQTEYGLISLLLNKNIKSNFYEKSLISLSQAKVVIFKPIFLSEKFVPLLIRGTSVLLEGELIKTPGFETGSKEFSIEDLRELNSECVLFSGEKSKIHILSLPREKEAESLEFYRTSFSNSNHPINKN